MSTQSKKSKQIFCDINITPLTDIFLVLLIIMMLIAPLLDQQGLKLTVPGGPQNKSAQPKLVVVDVSATNQYSIDNHQISEDELIYKIKDEAATKKDGLLIQASGDATHGAVVRVMDSARNAGVSNISIAQKD